MSVKTYRGTLEENSIVSYEGNVLAVHLSPGAAVRHVSFPGSKGLLVANGDDFITVLWAVEPRSQFTLPPIKRVHQQLMKVAANPTIQPMTGPPGNIFYLDYQYGSGSHGTGSK